MSTRVNLFQHQEAGPKSIRTHLGRLETIEAALAKACGKLLERKPGTVLNPFRKIKLISTEEDVTGLLKLKRQEEEGFLAKLRRKRGLGEIAVKAMQVKSLDYDLGAVEKIPEILVAGRTRARDVGEKVAIRLAKVLRPEYLEPAVLQAARDYRLTKKAEGEAGEKGKTLYYALAAGKKKIVWENALAIARGEKVEARLEAKALLKVLQPKMLDLEVLCYAAKFAEEPRQAEKPPENFPEKPKGKPVLTVLQGGKA